MGQKSPNKYTGFQHHSILFIFKLPLLILKKTGCDKKISTFFSDYLVGRKTHSWNDFMSSPFSVDVGVGQGSALSSILTAFFIALIFHIFEKRLKNINIPASFLSFVDDRLFISQEKSFIKTNANLFCCYNIMSLLLNQFGLIVEHEKTEIFHFSKSYRIFNPLVLDLSQISGPILQHKDTWKYLGFIFNKKLSFQQHIDFYTNKALSTVKYMKMLENSN